MEGIVHDILPKQTFASGFTKQSIVLNTSASDSKYVDYAVFDFFKDDCDKLASIRKGESVIVSFWVSANENKNKPGQWFASCRAFKISTSCVSMGASESVPQPVEEAPVQEAQEADALPF